MYVYTSQFGAQLRMTTKLIQLMAIHSIYLSTAVSFILKLIRSIYYCLLDNLREYAHAHTQQVCYPAVIKQHKLEEILSVKINYMYSTSVAYVVF